MRSGVIIFFVVLLGVFFYAASQPAIWGPFFYPLQYRELIKRHATTTSLEPNFVAAVIFEESRFNAGQESLAGARGLMQLLPTTARSIAGQFGDTAYNETTLLEPDRNIRYGTYYLRYLLDKYGNNTDLALAAYNAGETNVDRWQKEQLAEIPFTETRNFVAKVNRTKSMYDIIYGQWHKEGNE